MKKLPQRPLWAEIDLKAIKNNINGIKKISAPAKLMSVVKANAYGHGALRIAQTIENDTDFFGVAITAEALELRNGGIEKDILILGWTPREDFEICLQEKITLTIFDYEDAVFLNELAGKMQLEARIHLKIDTGMSRLGFLPDDDGLDKVAKILQFENIYSQGIFSHLSKADELEKTFALKQLEIFKDFLKRLEEKTGKSIPLKHMANSAAILHLPQAHLDMVRAGIILYGLRPSKEVNLEGLNFQPVMTLKAKISRVELLRAGTLISYGGSYKTDREELVGTVPAGYADGYSRLLSGKGQVIFRGERVPILGRICMDQFMVDLSNFPDAQRGQELILLGPGQSADDLAEKLSTINYEITCMISSRVPRVYTDL